MSLTDYYKTDTIVPPHPAKVGRGHIWGICASLGFQEDAVSRIEILPDRVIVETLGRFTHELMIDGA